VIKRNRWALCPGRRATEKKKQRDKKNRFIRLRTNPRRLRLCNGIKSLFRQKAKKRKKKENRSEGLEKSIKQYLPDKFAMKKRAGTGIHPP